MQSEYGYASFMYVCVKLTLLLRTIASCLLSSINIRDVFC